MTQATNPSTSLAEAEQLHRQLTAAITKLGGNPALLKQLITDEARLTEIACHLMGLPADVWLPYELTVNYDELLETWQRNGTFHRMASQINSHRFPEPNRGQQVRQVQLRRFNGLISAQEAARKLQAENLRAATVAELIALQQGRPDIVARLEFVVAAGSIWYDPVLQEDVVCYLYHGSHRTNLELGTADEWDRCAFLAVTP